MEYLKAIWDIIFPKKCISCGREGQYLCEDCLSLISINPFEYCLCEKMEKRNKCENCKNKNLDKIMSATSFDNKIVKDAIHKLKYGYIKDLSIPLAFLILSHLKTIDCQIDNSFVIIPVPMHIKKKRKRGFNQSEEIAKLISESTRIKLSTSLIKTKETKPQMELNKSQRIENIKNCFAITNKKEIENKTILLLDDVYTTGTTMNECAKVLKENGVKEVWGLSVAREI
ncbi:MAG TPA: ComF family protein [Candidatus Pacearchaeota archaeon]|nr:ComF family protein [Candidatus Pacearchaeota archaeon]HPR79693.1 ComF family protein [Candidatus Pacearchaeota archaeon]